MRDGERTGNKSRTILYRSLLTTIIALGTIAANVPNPPAHGVGSFNNAAIADDGLKYLGQNGNTCKIFANNMVAQASGGAVSIVGINYYSLYPRAGAVAETLGSATKGDILQLNVGNTDAWPSNYESLHTAIVVTNNGGGNFTVVDSNFQIPFNGPHNIVHEHSFNVAAYAAQHGLTLHIWRLGTVSGSAPQPAAAPAPLPADQGYTSQFTSESTGYVPLAAGNSTTQWIDYKNTGSKPWYDSVSAGAAGAMPVHLATSHPLNRKSMFGASWGGDDNRAAVDFNAVYGGDDKTPTSNQHVVQPGQIARFAFVLSAPANAAPGTYQEYFEPLQEGGTEMNDPHTFMYVVVAPPTYSSSFVTESGGYYTISPGAQANAWIEYRNTGNEAWYDDVTAGAAGVMPVHLATSHPLSRTSIFGSTWGGDDNRAAVDFASVYEPDGTTLAPEQHIVWPNYVVKFNITFTAQPTVAAGTYQEFFEPLQEGGGTMNDPGTFIYINIP